jgi:hypothetical protein
MNYEDTHAWPGIPVDEIPREEISTLYSFGHYDGPYTGLVRWKEQFWYVSRFEHRECKMDVSYWIITLTPEQQEYALAYGKAWAEHFHSGMSWNPEGSRAPERYGKYAIRPTPSYLTYTDEGRAAFDILFPKRPEPDENAEVVGYFDGWRRSDRVLSSRSPLGDIEGLPIRGNP